MVFYSDSADRNEDGRSAKSIDAAIATACVGRTACDKRAVPPRSSLHAEFPTTLRVSRATMLTRGALAV
jgi:hypothetical protein